MSDTEVTEAHSMKSILPCALVNSNGDQKQPAQTTFEKPLEGYADEGDEVNAFI